VQTSGDASSDLASFCSKAATENYKGRCGYGPRLPLLVISPYAKPNFVNHTLTDTTSITRFIEDNWSLGRIGDNSYDAIAGPLEPMFDFTKKPNVKKLILDPVTGEPQ
jgi:phospholipase C